MSRASSAAAADLDPALVPQNAADALVRYLGALRADVWTFDEGRVTHVARAGAGGEPPRTLPTELLRIARGGLAQALRHDELGAGIGARWRALLQSIDGNQISIHALVAGEQVLGAISVVATPGHDAVELEAITMFAQQVAAILEKAGLHRAAQHAATSMHVQNRVLAELTDERDVPALRRAVEALLSEELGDVSVAVLPIDSTGRLSVPVAHDGTDDAHVRIASEVEIDRIAPALTTREACALTRVSSCWRDAFPAATQPGAAWAVGLHLGDRITGVLVIEDRAPQDPARDALLRELLDRLAPAVSVALDNAQLFAREHLRATRLSAANTLARTVTGSASQSDLYDTLACGVAALFGYGRVGIYDQDLHQLASDGPASRRVEDRERSLVSTALHRRRASRAERPDDTSLAMPIASGEQIHAVLHVQQPAAITPEQEADDLALLHSICEHAAACLVAIDASDRIERNYMDTIQALVHALEARDQYTADHSDVVAEWAMETGRRLGMNDDELRDLELGAILHDIGKVAIPDDILNKNGRLTDEEFEVMKSHTITGERILKPIGFLKNVAPIVRHEHERWDGRGYPDGISGTQIPLASRIIFVCDAYHAITSDRPYRAGQSHAFARRIITENAGTQFDPAVVVVFLDVIEQWCMEHGVGDPVDASAEGVEIVNPLGAAAATAADASDGEDAAQAA